MRYYLNIALPPELSDQVAAIERHWQGSSKSSPHLTIIRPRVARNDFMSTRFMEELRRIAEQIQPLAIRHGTVKHFNHQQTIYLNVRKTIELSDCRRRFKKVFDQFLPDDQSIYGFRPHITLANHLTSGTGREAWIELGHLQLSGVFTCNCVNLLAMEPTDPKWQIVAKIPLGEGTDRVD